jgi:hypothetical protein
LPKSAAQDLDQPLNQHEAWHWCVKVTNNLLTVPHIQKAYKNDEMAD